MSRAFRGVWVPASIWLSTEIDAIEKVILIEIDSFDSSNICYASNIHFAVLCGCSESTVKRAITNLIQKGYIVASYEKTKKGTVRTLIPRVSVTRAHGSKPLKPTGQIDLRINTDINNNKDSANAFSGPEPTCQDLLKIFGVGLGDESTQGEVKP